jgi:hypothetical protein
MLARVFLRPLESLNSPRDMVGRITKVEVIKVENVPHLKKGRKIFISVAHNLAFTDMHKVFNLFQSKCYLEGCFTPPWYEGWPLLLGYHPKTVAQYNQDFDENGCIVMWAHVPSKSELTLEEETGSSFVRGYQPLKSHPDGPQPLVPEKVRHMWEACRKARKELDLQLAMFEPVLNFVCEA